MELEKCFTPYILPGLNTHEFNRYLDLHVCKKKKNCLIVDFEEIGLLTSKVTEAFHCQGVQKQSLLKKCRQHPVANDA